MAEQNNLSIEVRDGLPVLLGDDGRVIANVMEISVSIEPGALVKTLVTLVGVRCDLPSQILLSAGKRVNE